MRFTLAILIFVLAIASAPAGATDTAVESDGNLWQSMARQDLAFIRDTLAEHHPGPVDEANPGFSSWFERGYEETLSRLPEVRGFGGWQHLLRLYVAGFADEHLSLELWVDFRWPAWAGIELAWNGERFVVSDTADDVELPRGALLESCDGQSAEALWQRNVVPFHARDPRPAMRFRHAHRLLQSHGNPLVARPQNCAFEHEGRRLEIELAWRSEAAHRLPAGPVAAQDRPPGVRRFGAHSIWLTLPTFAPRGPAVEAMSSTLAELPEHRDARLIVVDVRGNGGGSSHWTEVFMRALYGDAYVEQSQSAYQKAQGPVTIDYRASEANLTHFRSLLPTIAAQTGADSEPYRHFAGVVDGIALALREDATFHRVEVPIPETIEPTPAEPLFAGKVLLLTDHRCASACLSFADRLLALPGVIQVGQPTSADTPYMEVRGEALPSRLGALTFATKVYRGRARPGAGDYRPEHAFRGDLSDTAAVEAWLSDLIPRLADPPRSGSH
jgi:hypothetical protein